MLSRFGHTVKLIAAQFVKPYVKSNKNDANDEKHENQELTGGLPPPWIRALRELVPKLHKSAPLGSPVMDRAVGD